MTTHPLPLNHLPLGLVSPSGHQLFQATGQFSRPISASPPWDDPRWGPAVTFIASVLGAQFRCTGPGLQSYFQAPLVVRSREKFTVDRGKLINDGSIMWAPGQVE